MQENDFILSHFNNKKKNLGKTDVWENPLIFIDTFNLDSELKYVIGYLVEKRHLFLCF